MHTKRWHSASINEGGLSGELSANDDKHEETWSDGRDAGGGFYF